MSYLDIPRLHFAGEVFTDPSTVDNNANNYDPANPIAPGWNKDGQHHFKFQNCKIVSAVTDAAGKLKTTAKDDSIVGGTLEMGAVLATPKLVDLDTEWQVSSQIFGMKIKISGPHESVEGDLDTPTLRDLWATRVLGSPVGPPAASGWFQSILRNPKWSPPTQPYDSVLMDKWKSSGKDLSIKFVAYGYNTTTHICKVVGTIGPYLASEPAGFLKARRMEPANTDLRFGPRVFFSYAGPVPFQVDSSRKRIIVDLGNAIPELAPGGARVDMGNLTLRIGGVPVGTLDYSLAHYLTTAGVEELALSDAQLKAVASQPVSLQIDKPKAKPVIVAERPKGSNIEADVPTLRMNPGDSKTVDVFATNFGQPAAGQDITVRLTTGGVRSSAGLAFTALGGGKADANGKLQIKFTASDPGKVRLGGKVDGQIYLVELDWNASNPADWRNRIVIKVFDTFTGPAKPTWTDVQPIFEEYARLYPAMTNLGIDLSKQSVVTGFKVRVQATTTFSEDDPRYMPVSRDLSRDKKDVIMRWIATLP